MDIRKNLYPPGVENLIEFNRISDEKLERIICFIDETPALLEIPMLRKRIRTLATRARKYAIYLVLAGQDWRSTTIDASIRNQFSTVVQCKALNIHQSRVLLGTSDAVDLERPGEAILRLPGREPVKVLIPLIGDNEYSLLPAPTKKLAELPEPEIDQEARIRELHAAGVSKTNIQLEVFGYKGGYAYDKVTKIINTND
jgi:DNA segregation ATPase FtsK/SpoIIIE-like protein